MDKYDSWKKTEETQIDLSDLLRSACRQWKRFALCAAAAAVLCGGYGWIKDRRDRQKPEARPAEEIVLTEEEQQSVVAAVELERGIQELEEYLDGTVLMQIDPYHKNKVTMLYSIDHANLSGLQKITESYLNFILNGGAAERIRQSGRNGELDKRYYAELVSAYQKTYSLPYQVAADESADKGKAAESLFYVEVTGRDAEMAENLAADIQSAVREYSGEVQDTAGGHRLTLVSSEKSELIDTSLQTWQQDKKAQLTSSTANLKTMTDAFSDDQMILYKETGEARASQTAGIKNEENMADQPSGKENGEAGAGQTAGMESPEAANMQEELKDARGSGRVLKYTLLGLAGGAFAYGCVFLCLYLLKDTVKSAEEMKRTYTFPFYGSIKPDFSKGDFENGLSRVLNRVRMMCKKQGISALCIATDFPLSAEERECVKSMEKQLSGCGIEMILSENASENINLWDSMEKTGNVLMLCRIGTTTHRLIGEAMAFYQENGISVLGAAAFTDQKNRKTGAGEDRESA